MTEHPISVLLRSRSVADLCAAHGINARWSTANPAKVSLNYDQLAAKNGDPVAEACRGTVMLQRTGEPGGPGEYVPLAQPFRRFYAFDKPYAAIIDPDLPIADGQKWDGTLAIVYYDPTLSAWCVATRGTPDADIPCRDGEMYAQKFWNRPAPGWDRDDLHIGWTYCAEITGPDNYHTVAYHEGAVRLLAVFDGDGNEHPLPPEVERANQMSALPHTGALSALLAQLSEIPGHMCEGSVVVQRIGPPPWAPGMVRRVKVVNPDYHVVSDMIAGSASPSGRAQAVLAGTAARLLHAVPRPIADALRRDIAAWAGHVADTEALIATIKREIPQNDRKAAAQRAQAEGRGANIGDILAVWSGRAESYEACVKAPNNTNADGYKPSTREHVARIIAARVEATG